MKTCPAKPAARPHRSRATAITAFSLMLLTCAAADAQGVYKCQVEGRTVFQSSPCRAESKVATAATAPPAETISPPKKKTLAELLRERDGADGDRPARREPQADGANVLRSRMGAV